MLNLKKTAVAVLALGSSAVFAGTMGPVCTPGNVTVPCERTAWNFGAQALYLQTTNDVYAGARVRVDEDRDRVSARLNNLNADWGWGFKIEGSYHFNTGNDFDINWYHFNKSTRHNIEYSLNDRDFLDINSTLEPKWDAVNFEFGQHVDFGEQKSIRFHAGAQYARINHEFRSQLGRGRDRDDDANFRDDDGRRNRNLLAVNTTYNGFGPRAGMDMAYDVGNGIALYGKAAGAVLVGTSSFNSNLLNVLRTSGSHTTMAPELEGKLGATYTYGMAQGDLSLDVGYMWVNYFNPVHTPVLDVLTNSNFALNGLYFGAKWVGSVNV